MWLRAAKIAQAALRAGTDERDFYEAKLVTARFYMERILPQVAGLLTAVKAGKGAMMALDEAMF